MLSAQRRLLSLILSGAAWVTPMLIDSAGAVEVPQPRKSVASRRPVVPHRPVAPREDSFLLGARSFSIPFTVEDSATGPVEVHLFAKPAFQGAQAKWRWIAAKLSQGGVGQPFSFSADSDGEYWFATWTTPATSDPIVEPSPEKLQLDEITPQRKILVDTTPPVVQLDADSSAEGKIQVFTSVHDVSPIKKIEVRYVSDSMDQWKPVDQSLSSSSSLTDTSFVFDVEGDWQQLSIQLIATDQAGNQTSKDIRVQRPRIAETPGPRYADAGLSQSSRYHRPVAPRLFDQSTARRQPSRPRTSRPNASSPNIPVVGDRSGIGAYRSVSVPHAATSESASNPYQGLFSSENDPTKSLESRVPETILAPPAMIDLHGRSGDPEDGFHLGGDTAGSYQELPAPSPMMLNSPQSGSNTLNHGERGKPETLPVPTGKPIPRANHAPSAELDTNRTATPKFKPSVEKMQSAKRVERLRKHRTKTLDEAKRPLSEESWVPKKPAKKDSPREIVRRPSYREQQAARVPIRYSDSLQFSLDYVLEAVGARGVEAVELYGSLDEGKTWKLWGRDPDKASPFDIEVREEGVFAYRIVVVSSAGLASPRPLSSDLPDIVVVVDKQEPEVRIRGARYGEGDRTGALVILYECHDPNLMDRPITLSFSENVDGPWTTIAGGLRNDGDYVWPADPKLPRAFYLRMDAKDKAGNVSTYILDKAIDAQGLAPRARIRGFQTRNGS